MLTRNIINPRVIKTAVIPIQHLFNLKNELTGIYYLVPDNQKREFRSSPPKQGIIGTIFLIGGLSWSYNYLKRVLTIFESYFRQGMVPPPSSGLMSKTVKTFLFAATLPVTFPYFIYRFFKGGFDPLNIKFDNFQQDPRFNQSTTHTSNQQRPGYGRRTEWQHIPGYGWRYVEVNYGPEDNSNFDNKNGDKQSQQEFYQDFEDFFENAQRQYNEQQSRTGRGYGGWNNDDALGRNRTDMSRREAYKTLGLEMNASRQDIQNAHKKMLMKYHPDHGGSTEMASKINQARDVLLGKN